MATQITDENLAYYLSQLTDSLEYTEETGKAKFITSVAEITDAMSLPGVEYDKPPVRDGQADPTAEASFYVQIPWSVLAEALSNMQTATVRANTAAEGAEGAADDVQDAIDAAEAATTGAERVNAMLGGTGGIVTITVINRNGTSDTREIGFRIYRTFTSEDAMYADTTVPEGRFVMIAVGGEHPEEDPENGRLYVRTSESYGFICDLSGAQGMKGDTPVLTATAQGVIYSDGVLLTSIIKDTNDIALQNEQQRQSTFTTNEQTRQTAFNTAQESRNTTWTNWFSDSLSTGVRKLWNDFWSSINSQWNGFFGTSAEDANGVRKIWSTWYNAAQTAWNAFWPGAKNTWEAWFGTSAANGVQKQWADLSADAVAKTQAANAAAQNATTQGNAAEQKGNTAQQQGSTAASQGNTAASQGNAAEAQGNAAETKGNYAKTQGDYAKAWNDHPPYIGDGTTGDEDFWYLYDLTTAQYVKGPYAKGDDLDYSTMTTEEIDRLIDNIKADLVFATPAECRAIVTGYHA